MSPLAAGRLESAHPFHDATRDAAILAEDDANANPIVSQVVNAAVHKPADRGTRRSAAPGRHLAGAARQRDRAPTMTGSGLELALAAGCWHHIEQQYQADSLVLR
jgi:hypothetical protein